MAICEKCKEDVCVFTLQIFKGKRLCPDCRNKAIDEALKK